MPKIKTIEITNVLGIEQLAFRPGALTVISGANGAGKTSVIEAMRSVFAGGHDPGLVRRGADEGAVKLTLDNGVVINKRITATKSELMVLDPAGNAVPAPQTYVNSLADALAVDPAKMLAAKPKDLLAAILEAVPIRFDAAELIAATRETPPSNGQPLDLAGLDAFRKSIFEERSKVNRSVRDLEGVVRSLREAVGDAEPEDWTARFEQATKNWQAQQAGRTDELQASRKSEEDEIAKYRATCEKERDLIRDKWDADLKIASDAVNDAKSKVEAAGRQRGAAESLKTSDARLIELSKRAVGLDTAIDAIDRIRTQKVEASPVPGLEIRDGKVYIDSTVWDHVNLARRIDVAFQLAALQKNDIGFMVVDDAEHLDADTWEAFREGAVRSGYQIIAARVGDGALAVETLKAES